MYVKCFRWCLAHSKCSIHGSDYHYQAAVHDIGSAQWTRKSGMYEFWVAVWC